MSFRPLRGTFKGAREVQELEQRVAQDVQRYVAYMVRLGLYAEGFSAVGVDVVDEIMKIAEQNRQRMSSAVFFCGKLVFAKDSLVNRLLHNDTVFSLQRRLYMQGLPCVILPIRV